MRADDVINISLSLSLRPRRITHFLDRWHQETATVRAVWAERVHAQVQIRPGPVVVGIPTPQTVHPDYVFVQAAHKVLPEGQLPVAGEEDLLVGTPPNQAFQ